MPTIKFPLGDFELQRLTELAHSEKRSWTVLLTEGLRQVFVDHGVQILRLPQDEFEACVKLITTPATDPVVLARRQKLRTKKLVWED